MVTKLIILLVIVLGVIAAAQLMRVYELSAKLRKKGEHEISNRDNRMNASLMLLFMILQFIGFIWLMLHYGWTGRGEAASVHGHELDWLLNVNYVMIVVIYFISNFVLFFFSWKYVKKPGVKAFFYPHNNKLEMIWTVIPAIVLAVIIIFGLRSWNSVTDVASEDAITIELFAKQFDWTARYSGVDNQLGKFDYKLTEDTKNPYGLMNAETIQMAIDSMEMGTGGIAWLEDKLNDRHIMITPEDRDKYMLDLGRKEKLIRLLHQMKDSHDTVTDKMLADDIIQKDTLYLCKGKQYEFNFRSKDVLHSAYFPHFRQQINTVPGMTTRLKFTPDKTTEEMRISRGVDDFEFILMCNKICGTSHYKMKMIIVVMEEEDYNAWMKIKSFGVKKSDGTWEIKPSTFDFIFHDIGKEEAEIPEANEGNIAPAEVGGEE